MIYELLNDWLVRYGLIYAKRTGNRNKTRFIAMLLKDIFNYRQDVSVIEHKINGKLIRNIYVGNIKNAKNVIAANYDTPIKTFYGYYPIDRNKQRNNILFYIIFTTFLLFLIGFAYVLLFITKVSTEVDFKQFFWWIQVFIFGAYFYIFGLCVKGLKSRKNVIRNTSSILLILCMIKSIKRTDIAYVFYDDGCYNKDGLKAIKSEININTKIYDLDSIGADAELHFISDNNVEHIFACDTIKNGEYYISRKKLKSKECSIKNMQKVYKHLSGKDMK